MQTFEKHIVVSQDDLDNLNHVNNVRYVQWVQDIAEEHWKSKTSKEIQDAYFWILLKHSIDYKNPAILGDVLKVVTFVKKAEGLRTVRIVEIYDKTSEKLIISSETVWCFMSSKTQKPSRITQEVFDLFS